MGVGAFHATSVFSDGIPQSAVLQTVALMGRPTAIPPLAMFCRPEILSGNI
jgi:hypothetical protein